MKNLILPLFAISWLYAPAQQYLPVFDAFDKSTGHSGAVWQMEQDDDGFYWLATTEGLYRFDGRQAVKIHYLTSDTLSPNASVLRALSIDRKNNWIWLVSEQGIFRYDPRSGLSEHLQAKDLFTGKEPNAAGTRVVFTDRQGAVWSDYGALGIVRLPDKGRKAEAFSLPLSEKEKSAGIDRRMANTPRAFAQDPHHDNVLWVATRRGLLKFDKSTGKMERFVCYTALPDMMPDANAMTCIYAHPNGKVYLGTWNAGLLVFDPEKQTYTPFYQTGQGWTHTNATNRVTSIVPGDNGKLWVSGSPGLSLFDTKQQAFAGAPVPNAAFDYKDREGHFWQYKPAFGLYHRVKNQITQYAFPPEVQCRTRIDATPFDARNRQVYLKSICKGGFWALHVDRLQWQHFPMPDKEGESGLSGYGETSTGFWVIDVKNRLFLRAPGSSRFHQQPVSFPANTGNLQLKCRTDGQVFISGYEGYLFWLTGTGPVKIFDRRHTGAPSPDYFRNVSASSFDHLGRLWMTMTDGFSIFSPEENRFIHVPKKGPGSHLLRYNNFVPDDKHRMWATGSTEIGWIDPLKPEAGLQQRYHSRNGFPYTNFNIAFCERSYLWLTTNQGLVRFNPENGTSVLFECIKTKNITLIGGGKALAAWDGAYSIFHLDSLKPNVEQPRPYVAWFKVFENRRVLPGSPFAPGEIRLAPDENFFSIGFSALGLYDAHKIRFAYRLEGVDPDWVYPEEGMQAASYTNIAGGDYVFRLKTTDSRGIWTEQSYRLRIHVGTPWYETTLARLFFLLLLGGGLFAAYRFQKRRWALDAALRLKEQERQRLAELDAFKSRFFTNITHEFRTPLTVITGLAEELRETLARWDTQPPAGTDKKTELAQLRSNSEAIGRNGHDLLRLVNQMLDLARLEAGSLTLQYRQADVMQFLKITAASYQSLAQLKQQHLACTTDPDVLLMDFDPQRLQEITGNLLSNALKFTPELGSVRVFAKATAQTFTLTVEDTGKGIPEVEQARIFDRFYQSGAPETNGRQGSGIGLSLVKELVAVMGGSIRVESKPGEGSKFIVTLPITNTSPLATNGPINQSTNQPINQSTNQPINQLTNQPVNQSTIQPINQSTNEPINQSTNEPINQSTNEPLPLLLYVEDNPDLTRYMQQLLAGLYQVRTARDGQEGLALALEQVPDLILSDVMMPGMDGFELCRRLKTDRLSSHIPVVLLTARATVPDKVEGLQHGADAYLSKPFDRAELFATLHNLLENRRRLRDYFNAAAPLPDAPPPPAAAAEHAFLQNVRQLLDAHLDDEDYDMTRLGHDLAMSRMQLHRKFTALTGHPPAHFARAYRLQKARHLLETTSLTVSEIAYATGFGNAAWFSQAFREMFGKTPSEIRK